MPVTGIRRKVDDLGRVVIPAGIRRSLGIGEGDVLEVAVEGDRVVFAKPVDRCALCQSEEPPLRPVRGRSLCHACVVAVSDLALAGSEGGSPAATSVDTPTLVAHLADPAPSRPATSAPRPVTRFEERYLSERGSTSASRTAW